jgi:uncharacterized protein involved in outer membrane biogenesis
MEENSRSPRRQPIRRGKFIGILAGIILASMVLGYFVVTSTAFLRGIVLPRVSKSMRAKITVADSTLKPFSQVYLKGLKVETTGSEPLLTAEEVRVRYSLVDFLKGNINIHEITLQSPTIQIVQQPDGTSNLDPILEGKDEKQDKKSKGKVQLSIRNVALKNGTLRQLQHPKEGGSKKVEVQNLNVTLDQLGNGQSGKLTLAGAMEMEQRRGGTNDLLKGELSGGYTIALNQELLPETVSGSTKFTVLRAEGAYKDLAGINASLNADLDPKAIRDVSIQFSKANLPLGQVRLTGPLDIERKEGALKLELLSLDRNIMAFAAAGKGYDFRNSKINSSNLITISQNGNFVSANGNVAGNQIAIAQEEMVTPEINLNLDYQVTVNVSEKTAVLQKLKMGGESRGNPILQMQLDRPMNLSWGETVKGYKDAALNLTLTNFNLAEWRPLIGTNIASGILNATAAVISQQDGRILNTRLAGSIEQLQAQFGTNRLERAAVTFETTGTIEEMKTISLSRYVLTLRQENNAVLQANGSLRYGLERKEAAAQLTAEGSLPKLLALAQPPGANAAAGTLKISANYSDSNGKRTATGNVGVSEFTGGYESYAFTNFQAGIDFNLQMNQYDLEINQAALTIRQGFNSGGSVDIKGRYNTESKVGEVAFKTVDLNENAIRPVLGPSLGEKQLVSISLNASGNAKLDPSAGSSLKGNIKVANWVVRDPAGKLPRTPLQADLTIDGAMRKEIVTLNEFVMQLTPTERAKNALHLQARLDLTKTNAGPSTLSLRSESFDITPYYEMFAGSGSTNAPVAAAQPQANNSQAAQEPEAMSLPFQQLSADLKIGRFYLRELSISNWNGSVTVRSNVVQLNPFALDLNGSPLSLTGKVDLGQSGYRYDVALKADSLPLAPLANSFGSGRTNQLQGNLNAAATIRGAGITGPNLRKNLDGNFNLNLTNLNYQVVGPKLQRILVPISIALRVPELTQTPINWVSTQVDVKNGVANLKTLGVESEAFLAEGAGTVTLADIVTNSTLNIPIELSLRRSLAEKSGLLPTGTAPDARFARLPRFVSVKGTVGAPDTDINKLAIAGMLAKGAASLGLGNEKTEKALGAVGNILSGQRGTTNSSGTNATPAANLLEGLGGLLGGRQALGTNVASTNRSGTNAPAKKEAINPLDLLRGLPGNKKQ